MPIIISMMENKKEFKEGITQEAQQVRKDYINRLKEKGDNITSEEKSYLDFFLKCEEDNMSTKEMLIDNYFKIIDEIEYYLDIKSEYQNIVALWVIGTYLHEQFESFPYMFINAMRGSGKSRLLRLMTKLSCDGQMLNSLTEAVLFRTKGTLAIDEFEDIGNKEKSSLRELLNSGYKKGTKVFRMKQKKVLGSTEQVLEDFDVYRPIIMANISGMEEVLNDRCINIILEKSSDLSKIMLVENFDNSKNIKNIKNKFFWCRLCMYVGLENVYKDWNDYVKCTSTTYTTHTTHIQHTTHTTNTITNKNELIDKIELDKFFNKLKSSEIVGRNLELFMPLFLIAKIIGEDVLDLTIKTSSKMVSEKRHEEEMESRDVMLIDFVANKYSSGLVYTPLKEITLFFREITELSDKEISCEWVSRALKRLNLIVDKRRMSKGVEMILNIAKAKEKIKIFRVDEVK